MSTIQLGSPARVVANRTHFLFFKIKLVFYLLPACPLYISIYYLSDPADVDYVDLANILHFSLGSAI